MRTLLLALMLLPSYAMACGGFFCSQLNLEPVQQNAERILFEIHGDGTITATVEIRYQGSPDDFSWVVPVPTELGADDLDVAAPANALLLLDDATKPTVIPPPTKCTEAPGVPGMNRTMSAGGGGFDSASEEGVEVIDLPVVGPFSPQLLQATDADALVDWLNANDYLITPEMEPLVAEYVAGSMWFLALKLTDASEVSDIAPISMTYPSEQPMVPIQLTGVAAEPEMGVLTFIAAETRYEPVNFENLEIATDDVQIHPTRGTQNYYPLLSWRMDQAGGKAVVTQFAGAMEDAIESANQGWSWNEDYTEDLAYLDEIGAQYGQLTRLYARMSAWEMNEDPMFGESTGGAVSSVIDLSDREPIEVCQGAADPAPCGEMYCGEDATCGATDSGDGCICPAGTTARRIDAPILGGSGLMATVVCDRADSEMLGSLVELGFSPGDPCNGLTCGDGGTCAALNGFPTCQCNEGLAAVVSGNFLTCAQPVSTHDADALLWNEAACDSGCNAAESRGFGLLLLPLLALIRRR